MSSAHDTQTTTAIIACASAASCHLLLWLLTFQVACNLRDAVVAEQQHLQARQAREALQAHNGIVAEVYAVKLVLQAIKEKREPGNSTWARDPTGAESMPADTQASCAWQDCCSEPAWQFFHILECINSLLACN